MNLFFSAYKYPWWAGCRNLFLCLTSTSAICICENRRDPLRCMNYVWNQGPQTLAPFSSLRHRNTWADRQLDCLFISSCFCWIFTSWFLFYFLTKPWKNFTLYHYSSVWYLQGVWSSVDICGNRGKSWDDSDASVWAGELAQGGERNHSAPRQSHSPASTSWVGTLADRMVHLWPIVPPLTRPL